MKPIVKVDWIESQRGWGFRPDGCSLHLTDKDTVEFEKEYWTGMPKVPPYEYSQPGEKIIIDVKDDVYKKVKKSKNGIRIY